jgi:vacuolar-type H+-ATPase subunit E/Vma4
VGLEDILAAIRADTDAEIVAVLERARDEVSSIEAQAGIDGETAAEAIMEAAEEAARHEADRIVVHARSTAERRLADAVEDEYQQALARLKELLAELRRTPRYRAVLQVLLEEALHRLPDVTVVSVDAADGSLIDELLRIRDGPMPNIDTSVTSIGGATVSTGDGRSVHNTFETRIQRADGLMRAIAGQYLVGNGNPR